MSRTLELGKKAKIIRTAKMQTGRSSSIKGGGGNGGNISGKISKDAVRQTSKSKDSKLK